MQKNIVIISGHPDISNSCANKKIIDVLLKHGSVSNKHNVKVIYLDKIYKESNGGFISEDLIKQQQEILLWADTIILQFPLYWYMVPAVMKKWLEEILTYGFAFGGNSQLAGRKLIASVTIGSKSSNYQANDSIKDNKSMEIFLRPVSALAEYIGLKYLPPIYSFDMSVNQQIESDIKRVEKVSEEHAAKIIYVI